MAREDISRLDLVDVAATRPWRHVDETDGSVDDASTVDGAGRASIARQRRTAIQVDLGLRFPIGSITVDIDPAFAADDVHLRVSFSDDGLSWSKPAIDETREAESAVGSLKIAETDASWARHVRLVIVHGNSAAISSAEIWCERSMFDLIAVRQMYKANFPILREREGLDYFRAYGFERAESLRSTAIVGVSLFQIGAFGNSIIQLLLAIGIAESLNLKYIKIPAFDRSEMLDLPRRKTIGDITFIPATEPLPSDGYFLTGLFFDTSIQKLAGELDSDATRRIVNDYIKPLFNRLPVDLPRKADDELLVHIRSGDIFSTWVAPTYPQPPLAFYKMVIARLLAEDRITSAKLVFENRLNPVIEELEAHLREIELPFTTQSGSLADDVAALLNGRHLVFGLGTFGPGVCQLSDRVEQVFYFSSNWPQHFKGITTIGEVIEVVDTADAYTKVGEWDNSPERRAMMIDYPIENLAFSDKEASIDRPVH